VGRKSNSLSDRLLAWRLPDAEFLYVLDLGTIGEAAVGYSPEGSLLAAGAGSSIQLWATADGSLLHELAGHKSTVTGVTFLPDGRRIASASWDGTVRLWQPAEVPRQPELVSASRLECTPAGAFSRCVDELLDIEFEVPASWGEIETSLRTGGYTGFAYDYYFGGKPHGETYPLVAGGRSADFSEGRGAMPTDFGGYRRPGWQGTSACDSRWSNSYPLCSKVSDNVAWMIRFPNAGVLCEDVLGNWQTVPVIRIEISLPDNPTINGFVFEAPFFSERFAGRVENDLYPLLGARLAWMASKCDEASREAFDAQLMALVDSLSERTADAETLEKVDELVHLAESIVVWARP
jgi:hypothetical protein